MHSEQADLSGYPIESPRTAAAEKKLLNDLHAGVAERSLGVTFEQQLQDWADDAERHGYRLGWMDSQLASIAAIRGLVTDGMLPVPYASMVLSAALGIKCPNHIPTGKKAEPAPVVLGPGGEFQREVRPACRCEPVEGMTFKVGRTICEKCGGRL